MTATLTSVFHPTSLRPQDGVALAHALRAAMGHGAALTLFHHVDEAARAVEFPSVRSVLERWGALPAGSTRAQLEALGLELHKVVGHGSDPVRSADAYLHKHPAELMVLATEARRGWPRLLEPSTAEPLARSVECMTLFLPDDAPPLCDPDTGIPRLARILIPFDEDPAPEAAMWGALCMADAFGLPEGELRGIHVGHASGLNLLGSPKRDGWRWRSEARPGPVVDTILQRVDELEPDLIVMATHGHDGLLDALRGSVTEQVLRRAGLPLLAVPVPVSAAGAR